nr:zinc finger BED domain-containing protein 4-like [Onthophagus taurus]
MPKVNPIWEYYETNIVLHPSKAICKSCSKTVSLGSPQPKHQTIKGLKLHLSKYHSKEYKDYENKLGEIAHENSLEAAISKPVRLNDHNDNKHQTTIEQLIFHPPSAKWPDDHQIVKRIDKAIMDYIIVDMQPYTTVSGEGFKRLNFADPSGPKRYKLKSENYFRSQLMPETYEKVQAKVVTLLMEADWISFTTDIWSNLTKTCSLLSFTAHFVRKEQRLKVVLAAIVLEDDHTGDYIAEKLKEIVETYNIARKVHLAVRDNARNMVRATRVGEFTSLGCVAHTLQLTIHDAIFSVAEVETLIKKCHKVVGHFHRSEQARRHLSTFQKTLNLPEHALFQDVETRWNSTYLMMERLLEQKNALNLYRIEKGGILEINSGEWNLIEDIVNVLQCFYQATLEISSDLSCVSVVIPLLAMLNGKLTPIQNIQSFNDQEDDNENENHAETMKSKLLDALNQRFSFVKSCLPLITATLIDPRFKTKYLSESEVNSAKLYIIETINGNVGSDSRETILASSTNSSNMAATNQSNLWAAHDSIELEDESMTNNEYNSSSVIEIALESFLREPRLQRNANIFEYWFSSPYKMLRQQISFYLSRLLA